VSDAPSDVAIRDMREEDIPAVVDLLNDSLGPAPGGVDRRALFEWKHLGNPFGRSLALVAESEGAIVGLRSFLRWRFVSPDGGEVHAVRAVDTATSPAVQRRGVFSRLTTEALDRCARDGVDLVFNTPNEKSLPGYLKMGWSEVTRWPMRVRVRRPLPLVRAVVTRNMGSGPNVAPPAGSPLVPAAEALAMPEVGRLVEASARPEGRLVTPRSMLYLRWRYATGPMPYHVLFGGDPVGAVAVIRLRKRGPAREAVVTEVLAAPDSRGSLGPLLREIPAAAGADHAVLHAGDGWAFGGAAADAGYRRTKRAAMTFTVRPVTTRERRWDPLDPSAWSLTLGDLEVF
jgi:GNAT superfamily N-acetyltransferase